MCVMSFRCLWFLLSVDNLFSADKMRWINLLISDYAGRDELSHQTGDKAGCQLISVLIALPVWNKVRQKEGWYVTASLSLYGAYSIIAFCKESQL